MAASLATAAAVAVAGLIGFVGIIVPHTVRLLAGSSSYRQVLPLSVLFGAAFLILVDVVARTAVAPAEIPIGVDHGVRRRAVLRARAPAEREEGRVTTMPDRNGHGVALDVEGVGVRLGGQEILRDVTLEVDRGVVGVCDRAERGREDDAPARRGGPRALRGSRRSVGSGAERVSTARAGSARRARPAAAGHPRRA